MRKLTLLRVSHFIVVALFYILKTHVQFIVFVELSGFMC